MYNAKFHIHILTNFKFSVPCNLFVTYWLLCNLNDECERLLVSPRGFCFPLLHDFIQDVAQEHNYCYSRTYCMLWNINGREQPVTTMLGFKSLGFELVISDNKPVCNLPNPCSFWNTFNVWDSETCEIGNSWSFPTATFNWTTENLCNYKRLRITSSWQHCKNTYIKMLCHTAILQVRKAFFIPVHETNRYQNVFFISGNA